MTRNTSSPARILIALISILAVFTLLAGTALAQNPAPRVSESAKSSTASAAANGRATASASPEVVVDPTTRTVTTSNFVVTWTTSVDTEAITGINWMNGQNLTSDQGLGTCFPSFPGSIEYFGNSYAPPDPWAGGLVLVGGGTTTPSGTTAWSGQVLSSGTAQVTINSASTGCPSSSAGINVQTIYSFSNPDDPGTNSFAVQRSFDFTNTTFAHDFRPYMARLSLNEGFTEVLYPDTSGALATLSVYDCGEGCTGPTSAPGAAALSPLWDSTQGWFAMHNPNTLQGVVIKRNPSTDPQGNAIVAQLWVDNDAGSNTNVSSFLLMNPSAGFTGGLVTEVETLCFYDSSLWTPSLTPPAPCTNVGSTPSSTTLTSSTNSTIYGQPVTFTASVTGSSGTPTGNVVFTDTSTSTNLGSASLASGTASLSVSSLGTGSHSITVAYQGSPTYNVSTSTPVSQTVTSAGTTTSIGSSLNPAGTNQTVTFSAAVTSQFGGAATGSVTFYSGSQSLGTATVSGNAASLATSFSSGGTYSITAKYSGDSNNTGSTSGLLSEKVIASTSTALASSPNPAFVGQTITFTATVSSSSGAPPNGESVTFYNGSSVLGTSSLTGGIAALATSSLPVGTYSITAMYAGDANFASSTSTALKQYVNSTTKSLTNTTMTSSLNPSSYGQAVTFTATVTNDGGSPPTGRVSFTYGTRTIGGATLNSSGVATLTLSTLNADTYPLTAVYQGDKNNLRSTSIVLSQIVNQTTSSAKLASSVNPSSAGQAVTFTAKVTSPTVIPKGPVTFKAGKTVLGTVELTNGEATLITSSLAAGSTRVTATFAGDSDIKRSSASVTQVVQ